MYEWNWNLKVEKTTSVGKKDITRDIVTEGLKFKCWVLWHGNWC